ncbi:MAG: hypothetical protein HY658_11535 [Actinobacteria bacterium]|nr:hypothetical protein [Actinomycetota bacterium]
MRRFVVALTTLAVLFGGTGMAEAVVYDVWVNDAAIPSSPTTSRVLIFGEIDCTFGESFTVRVSIWSESGDKATGRASGPCGLINGAGPTPQNGFGFWLARARVVNGSFTCGEGILWRARGKTATGQDTSSGFGDIVCD